MKYVLALAMDVNMEKERSYIITWTLQDEDHHDSTGILLCSEEEYKTL